MNVTIYTTRNCPQCRLTKRKAMQMGLDFIEVDLDHDPEAIKELKSQGFAQAPVVVGPNDAWSGYRPERIAALAN